MILKNILKVIFAVSLLLLTGCTQSSSYTVKLPASELEAINLPNDIGLDGLNFTLKAQNLKTAEFYLPNERGFNWNRLFSVTLDSKADIKTYRQTFENTLKSGRFGKAKFEFKNISDNEYHGYTIYYPVKGDKNFDNYEINLIQTKKLACGLLAAHYAVKFSSDTDEKNIINFIDKKVVAITTDFPDITCK